MSTLELNLLMNLNHFEATTIMEVAMQLNVPIIQFHPDTLTSSLEKVIKPEDFETGSELIFYTDPGLGHPSTIGDIVIHGHKLRKVISHDIRMRNEGYVVSVANNVESSSIGAIFFPLVKVDSFDWIKSIMTIHNSINI